MTGEEIFDKINNAMLERQRMSATEHMDRYHKPFIRSHDLRLLKADCEAAFDTVDAE